MNLNNIIWTFIWRWPRCNEKKFKGHDCLHNPWFLWVRLGFEPMNVLSIVLCWLCQSVVRYIAWYLDESFVIRRYDESSTRKWWTSNVFWRKTFFALQTWKQKFWNGLRRSQSSRSRRGRWPRWGGCSSSRRWRWGRRCGCTRRWAAGIRADVVLETRLTILWRVQWCLEVFPVRRKQLFWLKLETKQCWCFSTTVI